MSEENNNQDGDFESPYDPDLPHRRGSDPMLERVEHKIAGMERRLMEGLNAKIGEVRDDFKSAFPGGDPIAHRAAHESMIKSASRWEAFKFSLFEHIAKAGGLALAVFVGLAIWEYFRKAVSS